MLATGAKALGRQLRPDELQARRPTGFTPDSKRPRRKVDEDFDGYRAKPNLSFLGRRSKPTSGVGAFASKTSLCSSGHGPSLANCAKKMMLASQRSKVY